jgi:iron complex transport system ATP-binding protein
MMPARGARVYTLRMNKAAVLCLHHVSFARSQRPILTDISWRVNAGEIAAILGPNGSGKSTLLRIISGYLWPQAGSVELLGDTFGEVPIAPLRARIGIVEATTLFPFDENMTAGDVVTSGYFSALTLGYLHPTPEQVAHAEHLLEQVGLTGHVGQLYATLSTGERLRCLLARALVRKPELLLLDEPTAGLDLPAREAILATLARLHRNGQPGRPVNRKSPSEPTTPCGPAMITVTHHLEELLPGTGNVLLLSQAGAVVAQGSPEKVLTDRHMTEAFGVAIQVVQRHSRFHAHVDPAAWNDLLLP